MIDLEKAHVEEGASVESAAPVPTNVDSAPSVGSELIESRRVPPPHRSTLRGLPALPQSDGDQRSRRLPNGRHVTTLTLSNRTCRWPIGDPTQSDFHYCGQRPESSGPYCEAHERKSYQASSSRTNHRTSRSR
jgi:hypothetical protein